MSRDSLNPSFCKRITYFPGRSLGSYQTTRYSMPFKQFSHSLFNFPLIGSTRLGARQRTRDMLTYCYECILLPNSWVEDRDKDCLRRIILSGEEVGETLDNSKLYQIPLQFIYRAMNSLAGILICVEFVETRFIDKLLIPPTIGVIIHLILFKSSIIYYF